MNWDQIESKWAAMTRRVQAEWSPRKDEVRDRRAAPAAAVPPKVRVAADPASHPAVSGAPTVE